MTDNIVLMQGDCLQLMKDIPDKSVDMILTDPPYGATSCKWDSVIPFDKMWEQLSRIIKDNGAIALFGSEPFSSALRMSNIKNFKYDWIWDKKSCGAFANAKYRPMIITEIISIFGLKKLSYYPIMEDALLENIRPKKTGGKSSSAIFTGCTPKYSDGWNPTKRYPKNILNFPKRNAECNSTKTVHPTQKPVALLEYLIKTYTIEGETVLDFTMGSGSTGVACVNTNRNFIGIELDEKYSEIAKKRIDEAVAEKRNNLFHK